MSTAIEKGATRGSHATNFSLTAKSAALLKAYSERQAAARQSIDHPEAAAQRLSTRLAPLASVDPRLAGGSTVTAVADNQWLAQQAPQQLYQTPLNLAVKGTPLSVPESLAASFNRTVAALADPFSAIGAIERGAMTPETPRVLQERRPGVLEAAKREFDRVTAGLAEQGKVPSYTFRVQASLATGKPYDPTMAKDSVALFQAVWAGKKQREAAPLPGAGGGGRGPQKGVYRGAKIDKVRFRSGSEENMRGIENE
jgi:hypothetical protein